MAEKMKIAYVYDAVYPWVKGGAEMRISELSKRLAARGHEVHCFGIKWWDGPDVIEREGVLLHGICRPMSLYSGERRSIREALSFSQRVLTSLRGEFELVDCQEFPYLPCFPAKLLSLKSGSRLAITWHEVWGDYWYDYLGLKGAFGKAIELAVSRLTDRNIAVSERTKADLEALGTKGVLAIPNGINFDAICRVRASDEPSDLVFAGRLAAHKNVDVLIRALGRVKREVPDVKLVIIGSGPEAQKLERLASDLGLASNIEFSGFYEDYSSAISRMKSSRAFVLPSTREGFGMVALDANACGIPVITVRHKMNATCDLISEKTGSVCDLSAESLASAILDQLSCGKSRRSDCIDLAKRYDWDSICSRVEGAYSSWLR